MFPLQDNEETGWVNTGQSESGQETCYIPHSESDNSIEYQQYNSTRILPNVDTTLEAQIDTHESEAGSFFPGPLADDSCSQAGHSEWNSSGANNSNHAKGNCFSSFVGKDKVKLNVVIEM